MGIDFTVFKGSSSGDIIESKGHRDLKPTEVAIKISHCGVCGTDEHFRHADQGLGHEGVGIITDTGHPFIGDAARHVTRNVDFFIQCFCLLQSITFSSCFENGWKKAPFKLHVSTPHARLSLSEDWQGVQLWRSQAN